MPYRPLALLTFFWQENEFKIYMSECDLLQECTEITLQRIC